MSTRTDPRRAGAKRNALVAAMSNPAGSTAVVKSAKKRCARATYVGRVVEIRVSNSYPLDEFADGEAEWTAARGAARPACIQRDSPLTVDITLEFPAGTAGAPDFHVRVVSNPHAGGGNADEVLDAPGVAAAPGRVTVTVTMPAVLHGGITRTDVTFRNFNLTNDPDVTLAARAPIVIPVYTIYGPPIRNNVRESNLYDAARDPVPMVDGVARIQPFFTAAHLELACGWAGGQHELIHGGVVMTIVHAIGEITYGEDDDYRDNSDGWNVWDNDIRSGDCSQQASFFADVLGTVGIRGVDFELKCDVTFRGTHYRRAFNGEDPADPAWPTHGVLLVNYAGQGMYTYDSSFSDPRRVCTLEEAITVGVDQYIPSWREWWIVRPDGTISNTTPAQGRAADLDREFDTPWWQDQMRLQAQNRFPDADRQ